jgi:hypothetical protein
LVTRLVSLLSGSSYLYLGGFTENHDFQATRVRFNPNNNNSNNNNNHHHHHHHHHHQLQQQQPQQPPYTGNHPNRPGPPPPMNYPLQHGPMPITTQVTIPHSLSACILGPRGTRIAQIRQQSGCVIKFDDPLPSNDRVISIIGLPNHIVHAQYLMQIAVKQAQQKGSATVASS